MTPHRNNMLDTLMSRNFEAISAVTDPPDGSVYQRHIPGNGIVQVTAWLSRPDGPAWAITALDESATRRFHVDLSPDTPSAVIEPAVNAAVDYVANLPGGSWK